MFSLWYETNFYDIQMQFCGHEFETSHSDRALSYGKKRLYSSR
jgi:hypothetical protein